MPFQFAYGGIKMYEGCLVEFEMKKMLLIDGTFDKTKFRGKIIKYNEEEECLYATLQEYPLTMLSLDAHYLCFILEEETMVSCTGMIKERFQSKSQNIVIFQVEKGFYKVEKNKYKQNINSEETVLTK